MTRAEAIKYLKEMKDGCNDTFHKVRYVTKEETLDMAIKALEQEPTTKNDLALIHTEGLDEEIRCTMCTNSMKSDRGCDGSCAVNKDMYKAVMDAIEERIQPTTKNDLEVDCISRADLYNRIKKIDHDEDYECDEFGGSKITYHTCDWDEVLREIEDAPSVTPQEPFINKPCISSGVCEHDKQKVLEKIRAELHATAEMHDDGDYYLRDEWIDEILDKYKAETEET